MQLLYVLYQGREPGFSVTWCELRALTEASLARHLQAGV